MHHPSTAHSRIAARRRLRAVMRYSLAGLAVVCVFGAMAFWLVTRSWFIVWRITPELQRRLGGDVTIEQAMYQGDGRVQFSGVTLRARGIKGEAGEIARIDRVAVSIDLSRPIKWGVRIASVDLDGAVLRVSEDAYEAGLMNFSALTPHWPRRPIYDSPSPPEIRLRNTAVEFGTHDDDGFHLSERLRVAGEMNPMIGSQDWYTYELSETNDRGIGKIGGITMKGDLNAKDNEWTSRLDGLQLDDRLFRMCPQTVQAFWRQMDLTGRVDYAAMTWNPEESFRMTLDINDVDLMLPVETIQWARYRDGEIEAVSPRPRMHFSDGLIHMTPTSLELANLTGRLLATDASQPVVSVPYRINFAMPEFPEPTWETREAWMTHVLNYSAFTLDYKTEDLTMQRYEDGQAPAVDLPHFVANVLEKFRVTDWELTTSMIVTRAAAPRGSDGQLIPQSAQVDGKALLHNASGRYEKFPYRLTEVDGYLQFNNERVVVHSLTGRGSGESSLRLWGEIAPPGHNAGVSLQLIGTNVPVDSQLREALHGHELEAYDMMFHRPAYESLAAAGLLTDAAAIERAAASLQEGKDQLTLLAPADRQPTHEESVQIADLEKSMTRLQRFVDAGPFKLGGTIDLDLNIRREQGADRPTVTTGTINVQSVGLIYREFPYPLRVTGGTLNWQADRVTIVPGSKSPGLTLVTPGGGRGMVTGELVIAEANGQRSLRPDLTIDIADDAFNDVIYAAIPLTAKEAANAPPDAKWPGGVHSEAALLLRGVGLLGEANYRGQIRSNNAGAIQYRFDVMLDECEALPNLQLAQAVGARGEIWPPGYALENVAGSLRITRDEIVASNITGWAGASSLAVNGWVNLAQGGMENSFTIDITNLPIGPYVLNLASESQAQAMEEWWGRYQPEGVIDANLQLHTAAGASHDLSIDIIPRTVSLALDDRRVQLRQADGAARLHGKLLKFEDLTLDVSSESEASDGRLLVQGEWKTAADEAGMDIRGRWTDARFESPAIKHLVAMLASPEVIEQYGDAAPSGLFDAEYIIRTGPQRATEWKVALSPRRINLTLDDQPVGAEFESGSVAFVPQSVDITDLRGRHPGGEFRVDGTITTEPDIDADLRISHVGDLRSLLVQAILPDVANNALDEIEFRDNGPTTINGARVRLMKVGGETDAFRIGFTGSVHTTAASLLAGVRLNDLQGKFQLDLFSEPGLPTRFNAIASFDHASAVGQTLTDGEAAFGLTDDGSALRVHAFRARAGGGVITANAFAETHTGGRYEATVDMVDVPLERFAAESSAVGTKEPPASATAMAHDQWLPTTKKDGGELFGTMSIGGTLGDPSSRRGRGSVRLVGGTALSIPLLMQIMQVTQLTVPLSGKLDYADIQMYIEGDTVVFERLLFENNLGENTMLRLIGEGEMNFTTLELDTRFRTRGWVPLLSDIMGGLGDMLYTIEVTGPLNDPKARIIPLP